MSAAYAEQKVTIGPALKINFCEGQMIRGVLQFSNAE